MSARAQMHVHPADFYAGLRPEQWIGRANSAINFEVYTVDWAQSPSGDKKLTAEFKQVRWEKQVDAAGFPTYTLVYMPGSSTDFVTGQDGKARLSFTPSNAHTASRGIVIRYPRINAPYDEWRTQMFVCCPVRTTSSSLRHSI